MRLFLRVYQKKKPTKFFRNSGGRYVDMYMVEVWSKMGSAKFWPILARFGPNRNNRQKLFHESQNIIIWNYVLG